MSDGREKGQNCALRPRYIDCARVCVCAFVILIIRMARDRISFTRILSVWIDFGTSSSHFHFCPLQWKKSMILFDRDGWFGVQLCNLLLCKYLAAKCFEHAESLISHCANINKNTLHKMAITSAYYRDFVWDENQFKHSFGWSISFMWFMVVRFRLIEFGVRRGSTSVSHLTHFLH